MDVLFVFQLDALFRGSGLASSEKRERVLSKRALGESGSSRQVWRCSCLRFADDHTQGFSGFLFLFGIIYSV